MCQVPGQGIQLTARRTECHTQLHAVLRSTILVPIFMPMGNRQAPVVIGDFSSQCQYRLIQLDVAHPVPSFQVPVWSELTRPGANGKRQCH